MFPIVKELSLIGLVPVIRIEDPAQAVPLAHALCEGGLPCAEVTFRTAEAEESIRRMAEALPEMLIGAGTVLTTDQVDRAIRAGAKFIVSPGLNPTVVRYCLEKNIPVIPGTATPSDMEKALELGLDTVKFFPAEANGGIKAIKAMAAPYTTLSFMPTGGINQKNITDYLSFPRVLCAGGSWMVPDALLKAGDYEGIRRLTQEAVLAMLALSFDPAGGDTPLIHTTHILRAKRYLTGLGYAFGPDETDEKGNVIRANIVSPISAFLVH